MVLQMVIVLQRRQGNTIFMTIPEGLPHSGNLLSRSSGYTGGWHGAAGRTWNGSSFPAASDSEGILSGV